MLGMKTHEFNGLVFGFAKISLGGVAAHFGAAYNVEELYFS